MIKLNFQNLGFAVLRYRKQNKITQETFAKKSGLSRNTISIVERGEVNLSVETLVKLAEAMDIDECDLLKELK